MAEKKETAKPEPAPKAQAATEGGGEADKEQGNKKINKMTTAEIDAKLNTIKTSQGGLRSRYAKQLFQHRKALGK